MTTYALQLVPKGWKVVPEEPTKEMMDSALKAADPFYQIQLAIKAAQPINTPPVLRWEGRNLMCGNKNLAHLHVQYEPPYLWCIYDRGGTYPTEQEARRAAEKALGFPDGIIIDESA